MVPRRTDGDGVGNGSGGRVGNHVGSRGGGTKSLFVKKAVEFPPQPPLSIRPCRFVPTYLSVELRAHVASPRRHSAKPLIRRWLRRADLDCVDSRGRRMSPVTSPNADGSWGQTRIDKA